LQSTTKADFNTEANRWIPATAYTAPLYSKCNGIYILGGYGKVSSGGNSFTRHYKNLADHISITVTYDAWIIDASGLDAGSLQYGDELISSIATVTTYSLSTNVGSLTTDLCGTSTKDLAPIQVTQTFLHAGAELYLTIGGSGIFGFRNVKVMLASEDVTANTNCAYTTPNTILDAGYNCACNPGQVFIGTCVTCDKSCLTCFDDTADGCFLCAVGYYFNGFSCLPCSSSCDTCFAAGPSSCLTCPVGYYLNIDFTCRNSLIDNFVSVLKPSQSATSASLIATSVLSVGTSATARTAMNGQMIQYIKYTGINYPSDLVTALQTWNQDYLHFDFSINQPDSTQKKGSEYKDVPPEFSAYDDNLDSTFFTNFWSGLLALVAIAIILVVLIFFEWVIHKKVQKEKVKEYSKAVRVIAQNLLITYIYADAADIFLFSVLDFKTNNGSSKLNIINLVVSIVFMIIALAIMTLHLLVLRKYHKLRKLLSDEKEKKEASEEFEEKYRGIAVLWKDFKERSIFTHSFLLIAVIRDIIFSLVLTFLYKYPLTQAIIIVSLSAVVFLYLILITPFEELKEAIQACISEFILLSVNICVLLLAMLDRNGNTNSNAGEILGKIVLLLCIVFNVIPVVFFVVNLILLGQEFVYWMREKRGRHKVLPMTAPHSPVNGKMF